ESEGILLVARGKKVRPRIGGNDARRAAVDKAGQPLHELAPGRMAEQIVRHVGPPLALANFGGNFGGAAEGPLVARSRFPVPPHAPLLITLVGKPLFVEARGDNQSAQPVGKLFRMVPIFIGVPQDSVKNKDQRTIPVALGLVRESFDWRLRGAD